MLAPALKTRFADDDYTTLLYQSGLGVRQEYKYGVANQSNLPTAGTPALFGSAAQFNNTSSGSESRIEVANSTGFRFGAGGTGDWQFHCRVYLPSTWSGANEVLFSKANGTDNDNRIVFYIATTGQLAFVVRSGGVNTVQVDLAGSYPGSEGWHTVSCLRFPSGTPGKSSFRTYYNAVLQKQVDTVDNTYEIPAFTGPLYLGYYPVSAALSWNRAMQDATCRNFVTTSDFARYSNDKTRMFRG